MADKRISELTELGDIASNDFIPLVDTSVNETKKVSAETLSNFVQNNIVIPPSSTNEIQQGNSSVEVIDTGTDGRVIVTTDGVKVAIFTTDGNVLIGTTSNPSDYRLVVGDIAYAANYDIGLTTEGSDTVALDFSGGTGLSTRAAAGTVTFTASNYRAGAIKTVRVIAGGSSRTLIFPTNWVFVGAKPASIASGKTGILTVTSFGTTEADCVAAWAVQT
jgi:hypothetical protein